MAIMDGKSRFRYVNGGYAPKVYDGHFLKIQKDVLLEKFQGAVIIADNHFGNGKRIFKKKIKFHTNIAERRKKNASSPNGEEIISGKSTSYNAQHREARSRVEAPNGEIKNRFKALNQAWFEDEIQQASLFFIACSIHNFELN